MEDQEHKIIVIKTVLYSVKSKSFNQRTKQTTIVIKVVLLQSTRNQLERTARLNYMVHLFQMSMQLLMLYLHVGVFFSGTTAFCAPVKQSSMPKMGGNEV